MNDFILDEARYNNATINLLEKIIENIKKGNINADDFPTCHINVEIQRTSVEVFLSEVVRFDSSCHKVTGGY